MNTDKQRPPQILSSCKVHAKLEPIYIAVYYTIATREHIAVVGYVHQSRYRNTNTQTTVTLNSRVMQLQFFE